MGSSRTLIINAIVNAEVRRKFPETQQDCCRIAAACDLFLMGPLKSDENTLMRAHAMAMGLFGEGFEAANEGQRWAWIDMCEEALRLVDRGRGDRAPRR